MKICCILLVTLFLAVSASPRRIRRQTMTVEDRRGPGLDDGQAQPPPAPFPVFTNPILNNPKEPIPELPNAGGPIPQVPIFEEPFPGRPPSRPQRPEFTTPPSDTTTRVSLAFRNCVRNCPSTTQYNPVCGSDGVTYDNSGMLRCAAFCGRRVQPVRGGTCAPLR